MLKNLSLGILGVFALTFLSIPAFAQEERELTSDQDYSITSDFEKQFNDALYPQDGRNDWTTDSELTAEEQAALTGFTALVGGAMFVVIAVSSVVGLITYIYSSWALMVIGNRLNMENSWFAWVPILNLVMLAKIGDINPWTILLVIIPVVNVFYLIYFSAVSSMKMTEKLGLDKYLGLLMFVPLVNYILMGYLAWGKYEKKAVAVTA